MWCAGPKVKFFFFFKQKTAYEMRISDWSSDVCSSDLRPGNDREDQGRGTHQAARPVRARRQATGRARLDRRRALDRRPLPDRKSVAKGKSVSVRVDLGGRRPINKIKNIPKAHRTPHIARANSKHSMSYTNLIN